MSNVSQSSPTPLPSNIATRRQQQEVGLSLDTIAHESSAPELQAPEGFVATPTVQTATPLETAKPLPRFSPKLRKVEPSSPMYLDAARPKLQSSFDYPSSRLEETGSRADFMLMDAQSASKSAAMQYKQRLEEAKRRQLQVREEQLSMPPRPGRTSGVFEAPPRPGSGEVSIGGTSRLSNSESARINNPGKLVMTKSLEGAIGGIFHLHSDSFARTSLSGSQKGADGNELSIMSPTTEQQTTPQLPPVQESRDLWPQPQAPQPESAEVLPQPEVQQTESEPEPAPIPKVEGKEETVTILAIPEAQTINSIQHDDDRPLPPDVVPTEEGSSTVDSSLPGSTLPSQRGSPTDVTLLSAEDKSRQPSPWKTPGMVSVELEPSPKETTVVVVADDVPSGSPAMPKKEPSKKELIRPNTLSKINVEVMDSSPLADEMEESSLRAAVIMSEKELLERLRLEYLTSNRENLEKEEALRKAYSRMRWRGTFFNVLASCCRRGPSEMHQAETAGLFLGMGINFGIWALVAFCVWLPLLLDERVEAYFVLGGNAFLLILACVFASVGDRKRKEAFRSEEIVDFATLVETKKSQRMITKQATMRSMRRIKEQ